MNNYFKEMNRKTGKKNLPMEKPSKLRLVKFAEMSLEVNREQEVMDKYFPPISDLEKLNKF